MLQRVFGWELHVRSEVERYHLFQIQLLTFEDVMGTAGLLSISTNPSRIQPRFEIRLLTAGMPHVTNE